MPVLPLLLDMNHRVFFYLVATEFIGILMIPYNDAILPHIGISITKGCLH